MQRRNPQPPPSSSDEEAEEAQESLQLSSLPPSQSEEGEDLEQNLEQDYESIPELDHYEDQGVDHEEYEPNPEARKAAERKLNKQEFQAVPQADIVEEYAEEEDIDQNLKRVRLQFYQQLQYDEEEYDDSIDLIDAQSQKGSFSNWVATDSVRKYIKRHLANFILKVKVDNQTLYFQKLKSMCINNETSLVVQYEHLWQTNPKLIEWLVHHPQLVLPEYHAAVYAIAGKTFPAYKSLIHECYFKIRGVPITDSLRTISFTLLGQIIKTRGVVTHLGATYSQLRKIYYKCLRCGYVKGPFYPTDHTQIKLDICYACKYPGPYRMANNRTVYRNFRGITVQQSPSDVAPGRIPRSKEVILTGDLVDQVKPGDQIEITGTFTSRYECGLNVKQGFPLFQTFIEANHIEQVNKMEDVSQINQIEFQKFSKENDFAYRLYNSIAPSIYGHMRAKRAITLALFGGMEKDKKKISHRTRGDINVLLLGDPGLAKSQFLKSVQRVFPRCVYTTGKGASAVGLTAGVKQDHASKEWKLEAGALVIADKGVCLIDEFDKMTEQDRTSIHQAMEQQTISISKAGIIATLQARCAVIAAANPTGGYYNEMVSFKDNVELSEPILSRFDLLCVMKDKVKEDLDQKLSSFVINQHITNHPYTEKFIQDNRQQLEVDRNKAVFKKSQEFIKQYIKYARNNINPELSNKTAQIINDFYLKIRMYSKQTGGISIVTRHLESMIRIAQAHARMHLRKETNEEDAKLAISAVLRSFIDTQRHSTGETIKRKFKKYIEECID